MEKFVHRNVRTGEILTAFDSKQKATAFSQSRSMPESVRLFHMTDEDDTNLTFNIVPVVPAS